MYHSAHSACCTPGPQMLSSRAAPHIPSEVQDLEFFFIAFHKTPAGPLLQFLWVSGEWLTQFWHHLQSCWQHISLQVIDRAVKQDRIQERFLTLFVISLQVEHNPLSTKPSDPNRLFCLPNSMSTKLWFPWYNISSASRRSDTVIYRKKGAEMQSCWLNSVPGCIVRSLSATWRVWQRCITAWRAAGSRAHLNNLTKYFSGKCGFFSFQDPFLSCIFLQST